MLVCFWPPIFAHLGLGFFISLQSHQLSCISSAHSGLCWSGLSHTMGDTSVCKMLTSLPKQVQKKDHKMNNHLPKSKIGDHMHQLLLQVGKEHGCSMMISTNPSGTFWQVFAHHFDDALQTSNFLFFCEFCLPLHLIVLTHAYSTFPTLASVLKACITPFRPSTTLCAFAFTFVNSSTPKHSNFAMHVANPYSTSSSILLWSSIWIWTHTFDIFVISLPCCTIEMEASTSFNLFYEYFAYCRSSFGTPNL